MRTVTIWMLAGALVLAGAASGHDGGPIGAAPWQAASGRLLGVAVAGCLYAGGLLRLRRACLLRRILGTLRPCGFACGLAVLAAALLAPIDTLAARFFHMHMIQHLLLMLVAPPLLVAGRPMLVALWCLPAHWRSRLARCWAGSRLPAIVAMLDRPLPVWLAASAALWLWHIPGPYRWALSNPTIHLAEHGCFLLSSLAFWKHTMPPFGRTGAGQLTALWMVVTFALHGSLLGALLTFAPVPLYGSALAGDGGLSALEDQQLAGLLMWVPAAAVYLLALAALVLAWLARTQPSPGRRRHATPPAPPINGSREVG